MVATDTGNLIFHSQGSQGRLHINWCYWIWRKTARHWMWLALLNVVGPSQLHPN